MFVFKVYIYGNSSVFMQTLFLVSFRIWWSTHNKQQVKHSYYKDAPIVRRFIIIAFLCSIKAKITRFLSF